MTSEGRQRYKAPHSPTHRDWLHCSADVKKNENKHIHIIFLKKRMYTFIGTGPRNVLTSAKRKSHIKAIFK